LFAWKPTVKPVRVTNRGRQQQQ